ncbi:MAG: hypothetical protein ACOVOV_02615 [Dolichospermum sp.]
MKHQNTPLKAFLLLVASVVIFYACRKHDLQENINQVQKRDFFEISASTDPLVKKVANYLQQQPIGTINYFVANGGYPIWEKAVTSSNYNFIYDNPQTESTNDIVIIPLVLSNNANVNAFLKAEINADTVVVNLFKGKDYKKLGYGKITDNSFTAEKMVHNLMLLNFLVNGYKLYNVTDTGLFKSLLPSNVTSGTVGFEIKPPKTQGKINTEIISVTTSCIIIRYQNCTTPGYCSSRRGGCDYYDKGCGTCTGEVEICSDTYSSSGSGIYVPPSPPSGSTPSSISGGSSSGNDLSDGGSGGLGWEPEIVDNNGFYKSRIQRLKMELAKNPDFLIPCDSLNLIPLDPVDGYGTMYKRIASYEVPPIVHNYFDSINLTADVAMSTAMGYPKFEVQNLNSGTSVSPRVNCDYFPIRISKLPPNQTIYTVLEYFKNNINQFINDTPDVQFNPYNYFNIDFSDKFNKKGVNSLGAVLSIKDDMFYLAPVVKASVVVSDYFVDSIKKIAWFKFSTITSPFDGKHPVSGNREFGIFEDPNRPGEFCFYNMGVDRITDFYGQTFNLLRYGYERADKLWTRIQSKIISTFTQVGGEFKFYSNKNIKARPKWEFVEKFFKGDITFDELKKLNGC